MSNQILTILTICVPIITSLISGITSYILAVKNSNKEIEKLKEQHKHDLENMKENHKLEMEKLKSQQEHEKEMKNQNFSEQLGAGLFQTITQNQKFQEFMSKEFEKAIKGDKRNG